MNFLNLKIRDKISMPLNFIHLLKAIAIVIITFSHFKPLLPEKIAFIASGGALGCALFFFCSGFTLFKSVHNNKYPNFYNYFFKRISRIYPSIWVFLCLMILFNQMPFNFSNFLFPPTRYWFLQAIIIFYFAFYFVIKYFSRYLIQIFFLLIILSTIIYFVNEHSTWIIDYPLNPTYVHWIYYFAIMIMGAYFYDKKYLPKKTGNISAVINVLILLFLILVLYGIKFLVMKEKLPLNSQLLFPYLLFVVTFMFYKTSLIYVNFLSKFEIIIKTLSKLTLEIYIVQFLIIYSCMRLSFPYGFLMAICSILISSYILNLSSSTLYNMLNSIFIKINTWFFIKK